MELLFTYGTLQDPLVQERVFGRVVQGRPDRLTGYRKFDVQFLLDVYPMIEPDENTCVDGLVIAVTAEELVKIDDYETEAYRRIRVTLDSGETTWVYSK